MSDTLTLALNLSATDDDGLIKGVSLITEGEVIGHSCFADKKTNQTVLAACNKVEKVKVKINHSSDASTVVGVLKNFRIEGTQVKADLQLLKNSSYYNYLIEMSKELAGHFGLSIAFKPTFEKLDKKNFVRCTEIYSADVVDSPAANPNGLFAMKKNTETTEPTPAENEELAAAALPAGTDEATTADPSDATDASDDAKAPVCPTCKKTAAMLDKLKGLHDTASAAIDIHKKKIDDQSVAMAAMQKTILALGKANEAAFLALSEKIDSADKQVGLTVEVMDALNNKLDTYKAEFDSAKETFEATVTSNQEEFSTKLEEQKTEFSTLIADADVIACRKLAKTGVPMNLVPSADVALSVVSIVEQLDAITNPMEKQAFFVEHKAEIYKAYQANINKKLITNTAN